jgi:preprotein translocase subunit SecG|uniref:Preprotein-translocase subunit g n=1 Tax=Asterionellopsis glacialis TaxID=33640 RepID=A0A023H9T9_9STRA|nr:preprotein-translocase subunit g [Asterionellopsis glacialis]AGH28295.1 preprotein-translocase subunit g [Asterionellopsis glacialis]
MLKQLWVIISLFIIFIIFWRMPQQNIGLASFANKSDLLGSPTSAQRSLNLITACAIIVYFGCAIFFNLV